MLHNGILDVRVVWCGVLCRYFSANCMTDRLAALELLADEDSSARAEALQHFYDTYRNQPLAMLNWLYVQVNANSSRQGGQSVRLCGFLHAWPMAHSSEIQLATAAMRIGTLLGP